MNQKNLISVLAVLVLIFGGTTIYFLVAQIGVAPVVQTPTPISRTLPAPEKTSPVVEDETVNWKTYTSDEIGFSFKYPLYLRVEEVYEEKNKSTGKPYLNLSLYSSEIHGGILVDAPVFGLEGYENISKENSLIGGIPTRIIVSAELDYSNPAKPEGTQSPSNRVAFINFKHNQKDFIIFLYYKNSSSDKNYKEIKQILSTFQFIK